jgi:tRNA-binding EMAP/Myf-like protein
MKKYLIEHMEFHPNQRELYELSLQLDESEENELNVLSSNIATKGYDLAEIIPLY